MIYCGESVEERRRASVLTQRGLLRFDAILPFLPPFQGFVFPLLFVLRDRHGVVTVTFGHIQASTEHCEKASVIGNAFLENFSGSLSSWRR